MHVKTTPNLPLREAVRMSSAYPGQWPYNSQREPVSAFIYSLEWILMLITVINNDA